MKKYSIVTTIALTTLAIALPTLSARANLSAKTLAPTPAQSELAANAAEAEAVWRTIANQDPKNAIAHYNLGIALAHQQQWQGAIAAYQSAIQHNPKLTAAYLNLGKALTAIDQLPAATQAYETALRIDPKLSLARDRLNELQALSSGGSLAAQSGR